MLAACSAGLNPLSKTTRDVNLGASLAFLKVVRRGTCHADGVLAKSCRVKLLLAQGERWDMWKHAR